MNDSEQKTSKPALSVIQGGRLTPREFIALPMAEKMARLREMPAGKRMDMIIEDPDGQTIARKFAPQEYYLMLKEVGENDVMELLRFASTDQIAFCLDIDLWDKWSFCPEQACRWFEWLLGGGELDMLSKLRRLDPELLQLFLLDQLAVGGGSGDLALDEERLASWDHTFDNTYYITFLHPENARLMGTILDIVYRLDQSFYLDLMEGCRFGVKSELEELSLQFRSGRLADLGFPDYEQAIVIYAAIPPADFVLTGGKHPVDFPPAIDSMMIAPPSGEDGTLLTRALAAVMNETLQQEMGFLLNSAIIAEHGGIPDEETIRNVAERFYGWLNIALEHLAKGDENAAASLLLSEPLQRLFRLGVGIVQEVAREARSIKSDNYAAGKALRGLASSRPRFYRGLDPDHADGYREFRHLDDVSKVREFLAVLQDKS